MMPPDERYVTSLSVRSRFGGLITRDRWGVPLPFRSVDTPVANKPREATAREPPRSTMQASVPPWRMLRRF